MVVNRKEDYLNDNLLLYPSIIVPIWATVGHSSLNVLFILMFLKHFVAGAQMPMEPDSFRIFWTLECTFVSD